MFSLQVTSFKMKKNKVLDKLKSNRAELRKFGVVRIGLFGSRLKGNPRWNSDVDLLVKMKDKTFRNYMGLLFMLRTLLKKKVDLVPEESLLPGLSYVKKEAVYVKI
jgi:predicted nucleotidyltransferase